MLKSWPEGGPRLVWTAELHGVGYGSPAAAGDRLYVLAATDDAEGTGEYALCLDAKTGVEIWRTALPAAGGKYLQGWGSGPRSTPTIDGDFLYVLGARGDLLALKTGDGSTAWTVDIVKDFKGRIPNWGFSESVLIDGEKLACTPGGKQGSVLALNKKTGSKIWQSAELKDGAGYASLVPTEVGGVRQYVTQTQESACGVRASDGKLLWRVAELKRATAVIPTPIVHDGFVFLTSGYGAGCELLKLTPDGNGGTEAEVVYTKIKTVANHHGGVVRVGEYIYGHSDRGDWLCFEYLKGKESEEPVWKSRKLDKGSVTYADGHLYCFGQGKGTVVLAEASPKEWKETGRFELPKKSALPRRMGQIWSHPVVSGGKLYLRDHELLFCYDVADGH